MLLKPIRFSLIHSWKSGLTSTIIPTCLWLIAWRTTILLKFNDGWFRLLFFLEKTTSCAGLWESRLKLIFHWNAHFFSCVWSWFTFFADKVISWTTKKRELSSGNNLEFETKLSEKSLINVKKKKDQELILEELLL